METSIPFHFLMNPHVRLMLVGWSDCGSVGRSDIISSKDWKLHFHASIGRKSLVNERGFILRNESNLLYMVGFDRPHVLLPVSLLL